MWWHKSRIAATRGAAVLTLTLAVAACFRPLYGPTVSGRQLDSVLASIDVADVAVSPAFERVSHYLRNELIFDLNGSGIPQPKQYRLALSFSESLRTPIVESTTGRAESATLVGTVAYKLTSLDGKQVLAEGTATSYATYDRTSQRFATVRAARDADIRLAKDLSDQIRTRLAVALSASS